MYNYFADSNASIEDPKKKQEMITTGQLDCESLKTILDTFNLVRYVNAIKNTQQVKSDEV